MSLPFTTTMQPLDHIAISSYNCRGFNTPEKRSQILYHFHKAKTQILLLQETHFKSSAVSTFKNPYYQQWFHSTNPQAKSKGVSIAFHKSFHPEVLDSLTDPSGHFLFLRLKSNSIFTVANVYGPNQASYPWSWTNYSLLVAPVSF